MSFISVSFAFFFFIFILLYHLAPRFNLPPSAQQLLILAGSFIFYMAADLRFAPFLLYIIAVSYFAGLFCKTRLFFALFLIADLVPLLFFKYAPQDWRAHIIFPLGLSFFTFQSISYIADCYTNKITPEKNPLIVATFISFFPTISSGPIQRAPTLIPQLKIVHHFDYYSATDGMKIFAWGLFKKLCVADRIALYVNYVYNNAFNQYGLALFFATILYSFQIYCDFSGYSDMAIGIARYLGFDVGKNFDHPYLSKSIGEFWRRWHISLSSWLRDYIYIPLGGSRVFLPRIYANLVITFLVSGIWHGAGWNFVVWGLIHGLYQCIGRVSKPFWEKIKVPNTIKIFITFCLVTFAWIFFRTNSLEQAGIVIGKITRMPFEIIQFLKLSKENGVSEALHSMLSMTMKTGGAIKDTLKTICLLLIFIASSLATIKKPGIEIIRNKNVAIRWALYICLIFVTMFYMSSSYSGNFIYQSF